MGTYSPITITCSSLQWRSKGLNTPWPHYSLRVPTWDYLSHYRPGTDEDFNATLRSYILKLRYKFLYTVVVGSFVRYSVAG